MKITQVRNELNISIDEIAEAIGMSGRNWRRIECGELDLKLKDAWQLWAFLVSKGMSDKIDLKTLFK